MTKRRYGNMLKIANTKDLWVFDTPVTQAFYEKVMGDNPSFFKGDDERPVENITWYQAIDFCNRLSDAQGLSRYYENGGGILGGGGFRLLTTKEWDYCCYVDGHTYSGTSSTKDLDLFAWYKKKATLRVRQLLANSLGLFDMNGNVWEWVYDNTQRTRKNRKRLMGGCYKSGYLNLTKDSITTFGASDKSDQVGFRICKGEM
jgi:sulfatase modifying factor 1